MPDPLHTALNDTLRRGLGLGMRAIGYVMQREMEGAVARYERDQRALRARYGITTATPVRPYDEETRRAVEAAASRYPGTRFAYTSGSTSSTSARG